MWIFTKEMGSFNTDHIKRIESVGTSTYVVIDTVPMCISRNPVENIIRDAIRRGDNFVEVE